MVISSHVHGLSARNRLGFTIKPLGTPIRVHPMFWIVTAILGWPYYTMTNDFTVLLTWIMAVFFSILVHELGHVFMGKYFGTQGYIILHGFGGVAIGSNNLSNRWKRIAVTLAGPGIQLLLYAFILFLSEARVILTKKMDHG